MNTFDKFKEHKNVIIGLSFATFVSFVLFLVFVSLYAVAVAHADTPSEITTVKKYANRNALKKMRIATADCSEECGTGHQYRQVYCTNPNVAGNPQVEDKYCTEAEPVKDRECNTQACTDWEVTNCQPCTEPCGVNGTSTCDVTCPPLATCKEENKPQPTKQCNENVSCGTWTTGQFGSCEGVVCGPGGTQTRSVDCSGDVCKDPEPSKTQDCALKPCVWFADNAWSPNKQ